MKKLTDNWKKLIDVDFPEVNIPAVYDSSKGIIKDNNQYEYWRERVLDTPLPGDKKPNFWNKVVNYIREGIDNLNEAYELNQNIGRWYD